MEIESKLKQWKGRMAVGRMAYQSGLYTLAAQHFRRALQLVEENKFPDAVRSRTLVDLAKTLGCCGNFDEGERLLSQAISLDQSGHASVVELIEDYHQLSLLLWREHKTDPSDQACQQAWELLQANAKEVPDELTAKLLKHRAVLAGAKGAYGEAEKLINKAIDFIAASQELDRFAPIYGDSLMIKLMILTEQDRFDEARDIYTEAIKVLEVSRGDTHVKTLEFLEALLGLANEKGLDKAASYLDSELKRAKSILKMKEVY